MRESALRLKSLAAKTWKIISKISKIVALDIFMRLNLLNFPPPLSSTLMEFFLLLPLLSNNPTYIYRLRWLAFPISQTTTAAAMSLRKSVTEQGILRGCRKSGTLIRSFSSSLSRFQCATIQRHSIYSSLPNYGARKRWVFWMCFLSFHRSGHPVVLPLSLSPPPISRESIRSFEFPETRWKLLFCKGCRIGSSRDIARSWCSKQYSVAWLLMQ